jgi:hypothetical protein
MKAGETGSGAVVAEARDYRVYGLAVRSDIELSGWPAAAVPSAEAPAVRIRRVTVSAPEPPAEAYTAAGRVEAGRVTFAIRGVARYDVERGSEVRVDPDPDARPEDVLLYLTGSVMGAILHQRGIFALHAAAVEVRGVAVAIAGPSGMGKSTLAATLVWRGGRLITDDIAVVEPLSADEVGVWPGAARVKLDATGLEALQQPGAGLGPAGGNRDKYHLPVGAEWGAEARPVPLKRLYIVEYGVGDARIETLSGMEAVRAVVDETYFLNLVPQLGVEARNFRSAAGVARAVRICRLVRPRGVEHLERSAALVEADVGRS